MGLPVGMDFIFHAETLTKVVPPYSKDNLVTVEYENSAMPSGAPESLGGVMLQLVIASANTTVIFGSITVDTGIDSSSRVVYWGDGTSSSGLTTGSVGSLAHRYSAAGTYYVRFTDCLTGIGIGANSQSQTSTLKQALRRAILPAKVTDLNNGCFQNTDYMDQEVLVLPGVTSTGSYTFGSMSSVAKAVRVLSMPGVTRCWYEQFYYGPSIEVLCVDNLSTVSSSFWSSCPSLKWVLIRGKTCVDIQNSMSSLFNGTTSERGIVGSDGYILNKELFLDY